MKHLPDAPAFCRNLAIVLALLFVAVCPTAYKELSGDSVSLMRIASSVIYALPLCLFIASIRRRWLFSLVVSVFLLFSCVETLMVAMYDNYITAGNILSVVNTNAAEGGGFIAGNISRLPYIIPLLIIGITPVLLHRNAVPVRQNAVSGVVSLLFVAGFLTYQLEVRWGGVISRPAST